MSSKDKRAAIDRTLSRVHKSGGDVQAAKERLVRIAKKRDRDGK